ncbi:MAG: rod shape-determining protein MreC [Trueperaceae bacterium]
MPSFVRAWYVFVALALLTFALTAFVGRVPASLSAAVALPNAALYRAGVHLRETVAAMLERSAYRAEIEALQRDRVVLEESVRRLELQVEGLERLLDARREQSPAAIASVPVIARSAGGVGDTLTLAVAGVAGVLPQMPVTSDAGLVGVVTEVTGRTAVVRTLLDPRSRVGVTVRERGGQGVAIGDVGGVVRVDRFVAEGAVEVGDVVETSAVGGLFPRGLRVGVVVEVLPQDPNELRRSFLVAPAVDLATTLDVVLIAPP